MTSVQEHEVVGEPGEVWTICVPRQGAPSKGAIQGTPAYSFVVSPSMGDELERSLRSLTPSLRRGRPMLYRGDRELLPERPEEAEERELLAARATASDPAEAAAMFEAVSLRGLSRELSAELDRKRKELAALDRKLEETAAAVEKEQARQRLLVEAEVAHGQKLIADARTHYDAQLRGAWKLEDELEDKGTRSLQRLGQQIDLATNAKMNIDRIMRATTVGEMIAGLRGHVETAMNSPLGKSLGLAVAAKLAGVVASRTTGKPVTTEDALAAIVQQGAQFRERQGLLQELLVNTPAEAGRRYRAQGLVLGATFVAGGCELKTLAEYISAAA